MDREAGLVDHKQKDWTLPLSEARSGLPSKLLYAADLVLMTPTTEQLGKRVAEWRISFLDKGLKVIAGKSKVMLGSSGDCNMIVNSGKWPCGVW